MCFGSEQGIVTSIEALYRFSVEELSIDQRLNLIQGATQRLVLSKFHKPGLQGFGRPYFEKDTVEPWRGRDTQSRDGWNIFSRKKVAQVYQGLLNIVEPSYKEYINKTESRKRPISSYLAYEAADKNRWLNKVDLLY